MFDSEERNVARTAMLFGLILGMKAGKEHLIHLKAEDLAPPGMLREAIQELLTGPIPEPSRYKQLFTDLTGWKPQPNTVVALLKGVKHETLLRELDHENANHRRVCRTANFSTQAARVRERIAELMQKMEELK